MRKYLTRSFKVITTLSLDHCPGEKAAFCKSTEEEHVVDLGSFPTHRIKAMLGTALKHLFEKMLLERTQASLF
jgi:hypothetical protein